MNIVFDIFQTHPYLIEVVQSDPQYDELFSSIYSQVEGRLMPMKDEIEIEEEKDGERGIVILFNPPPEHLGKFIIFYNYSELLTKKMYNSFNGNDLDLLVRKAKAIFGGDNN